ncbi:MAG: hypothetical protein U1F30_05780 [Steroidobacteraceae bacterium]
MDPQVYVDGMVEGSVEVTGFKPFQGDRAAFQQTLFADRMSERFRRPQFQGPPRFQVAKIPGAEDAVIASFGATQDYYSYAHARVVVLAQGSVAVIDIRARLVERFARTGRRSRKMLDSGARRGRGERGGGVVLAAAVAGKPAGPAAGPAAGAAASRVAGSY